MTNFEKPPRYKTFLLTVWEERNLEENLPLAWRFGLEDPQTGRRRAFADLAALIKVIQWMISTAEATDESGASFTLPTPGPSGSDVQSQASSEDSEKSQNN